MNKKFYVSNRQRLVESITDDKCIMIFSSGYEKTKTADENYEFQVNNNFYYLTGIKQPNVHLVIIKDENKHLEILYIDEYDEMYEKWMGHRLTKSEVCKISGVYYSNISYLSTFEEDMKYYLENYHNVYLDLETNRNINHNSFGLSLKDKILNEHKDIEVKDAYEKIVLLRMSKQRCEVKAIKNAIDTTKKGIEALMKNAKSGMYEYQLEGYYDLTIKQDGNKPTSFKTIAASGINATILHYSTNNSLIQQGDLVLFDLGCKDQGYCSDITRTFPVDGKFTDLQKTIYNIVLKANQTVLRKAKANMTLADLQMICVDVLAKECLKAKLIETYDDIKKYYFHGVSHSLGLDTHDPFLRKMPLPENAVITNEPGLYFKEYNIGIRIEDDVLIKKDRAINLSKNIIKSIKDIEEFMNK